MKNLLSALIVITIIAGCGAAQGKTNEFSEAGFSFEIPEGWKVMPSDRYEAIKENVNRELNTYGRHAEFLTMILSPDEKAAFSVSKVNCRNSVTIGDIRKEREEVYETAMRYGDVETINEITEFSVAGYPALLEDVTRSAQGRGCTVKVLVERTIVEISFMAPNERQFSKHKPDFDKALQTLRIAFAGKSVKE